MALELATIAALAVLSCFLGVRSARRFRCVLRDPDSVDGTRQLVRGLRAMILAACAVVFIAAIAWSSRTMLVLGSIILAEEVYETGVVLLILRAEKTTALGSTAAGGSAS